MQSKASVVNWWMEQTVGSARLPKPTESLSRTPSGDMEGFSTTSPKTSSEMIPPSRERDEHDLIEVMDLCWTTSFFVTFRSTDRNRETDSSPSENSTHWRIISQKSPYYKQM